MLLCAVIKSNKAAKTDDVATAAANQPTKPGTKMSLMKAHRLFGHPNEDVTCQMAKSLKIEITRGKVLKCKDHTIAKAKQKNVPSNEDAVAPTAIGEIFYLDMMSVKIPKGFTLNKKNIRLIVDGLTRCEFVQSYAKKSDMPDDTCRLFQSLHDSNVIVKTLRMDSAGENKSLAQQLKSKEWKHPVEFQWTARDTPQQNSVAETAFASNTRRVCALFVAAKIPKEFRYRLLPMAMKFVTDMKNLQPVEVNGMLKPRIEHFYGSLPNWTSNLHDFGEAGTVKTRSDMQPKLDDRGVVCMFVRYPIDHVADTYLMLDVSTTMVKTTLDVIWLGRMYYPELDNDGTHIIGTTKAREGKKPNLDFEDDDSSDEERTTKTPTATTPAAVEEQLDGDEEAEDAAHGQDELLDAAERMAADEVEEDPVIAEEPKRTRLGRTVRKPTHFDDFVQACWTPSE
jgi:hypothetical protein